MVPSDDNRADEVVPMEVDRIGQTGWSTGKGEKGKGKGNSKGFYNHGKGKGKGKSKGKDSGKSSAKGDKGAKGKSFEPKGQGKTDKTNKQCFRCGKAGHFSKDCWTKVRVAQSVDPGQGATSSTAGSNVNAGNQHQSSQVPQPQQSTQYKVSQISCPFGSSDERPTSPPVVFDLRQDPISPCSSSSVRAVQQFFTGDNTEQHVNSGNLRVMFDEVADGETGELRCILLDSGADAAVFPAEYATAGTSSNIPDLQLHDAQGRNIPVMGMTDLEIHLTDETGRKIVIQENVATSNAVHQPILCFGRMGSPCWRAKFGAFHRYQNSN